MANDTNGQVVLPDIELDVDDLRTQLGVDLLEARIASLEAENLALRQSFGEWLTYVNMVDGRVQQLEGQPIVTSKQKMTVGPDGRAELERSKPQLPGNVLAVAPTSPAPKGK